MATIDQLRKEIERLRKEISSPDSAPYAEAYKIGAEHTLNSLADFLDTLEETDIERWRPTEEQIHAVNRAAFLVPHNMGEGNHTLIDLARELEKIK